MVRPIAASVVSRVDPFTHFGLIPAFISPFVTLKPVVGAFAEPYAVAVTADVTIERHPFSYAAIGICKICWLKIVSE